MIRKQAEIYDMKKSLGSVGSRLYPYENNIRNNGKEYTVAPKLSDTLQWQDTMQAGSNRCSVTEKKPTISTGYVEAEPSML